MAPLVQRLLRSHGDILENGQPLLSMFLQSSLIMPDSTAKYFQCILRSSIVIFEAIASGRRIVDAAAVLLIGI